MDDKYRSMFQTEGDVSGLNWPAEAFRQVYERYFANEDYYLGSADVTEAALRPVRQTIEIADDDLSMNWEQFIEFQTGYPLMVPGAETVSWGCARAKRVMASLNYSDNTAYTHWEYTFHHAPKKNRLVQEGGCLIHVVGHWGHPLTDNEASSDGGTFDINKLVNRDHWLIKSMDPVENLIGQITPSSEASVNLFFGGDTYVPAIDTDGAMMGVQDVARLNVDTGDVDADTLGGNKEDFDAPDVSNGTATEGTSGRFFVESSLGGSFLSGIRFLSA